MFSDRENEVLKSQFRHQLELACGANPQTGRGWNRGLEVYTLNRVRRLLAEQTPFFNGPPRPADQ